MTPRRSSVRLAETIKNMWKKVQSNPLPCIAHRDFDVRIDAPDHGMDPALSWRKLDRIDQQIPEDLLETILVTDYGAEHIREGGGQPNLPGLSRGPNALDSGSNEGGEIDLLNV